MALVVDENSKKCFNQQLLTYMKKQKTGQDARSFIEREKNLRNLIDSSGSHLLHHAALLNCTLVAQYLVDEGCDVDARDNVGNTPLMLAVKKSSQKTTAVLLKANADMYVLDDTGKPLVYTVLRSRVDRMIKIFLNHIQTICSDDSDQIARKLKEVQCPLAIATFLKRADVIKSMLTIGYEVDSRNGHLFGNTTLHVAVEQGNLEIVKVLVEYGADINAKNSTQETPLFKYECTESKNGDPHEILRYFVERGVDLLVTSDLDEILIFYLLGMVDKESLQILSPHIDFLMRDPQDKTALHCLASNFHEGVIDFARNQNFEVDARDHDGKTPLMMAVEQNLLVNVKFLLGHGANVELVNNAGETALTLAFTSELQEEDDMIRVVELLLLSGANAQHSINGGKTIFDSKSQPGLNKLFKPVLANLVLNEANGVPILGKIRGAIETTKELKKSFDLFKRQYEKLKEIEVDESVNLHNILSENQERIVLYKRNPQFMPAFKHLMKSGKPNVNSYYLKALWRRVNSVTML